ncbi:MAG: hypothetical protein KF802_12295 [Bdellovibrionaceae bacterium]|nr:hypothetical protein [Pseudobdellovibrionaceae bacterium]MBX3034646.1 hypothetical protein [Pseudobdellovibrionaceae bacterium]
MKTAIFMASLLLAFSVSEAKTAPKRKGKPQPRYVETKLGTSFRFDASSLHGKFQNSPSTTATVENDKYLEDLLGARKNFNDRIRRDVERN